jgi:hypothetical protein
MFKVHKDPEKENIFPGFSIMPISHMKKIKAQQDKVTDPISRATKRQVKHKLNFTDGF